MSSLGMAFGLFVAGMAEYAIVGAWYDSFGRGRVGRVVVFTHVQILLWLFVIGTVVAILEDPEAPRWYVLAYVEGCALSAGVTAWYSRRHPRTGSPDPFPARPRPRPRNRPGRALLDSSREGVA